MIVGDIFSIVSKISTPIQIAALALIILFVLLRLIIRNTATNHDFYKQLVNKLFLFIGFIVILISLPPFLKDLFATKERFSRLKGNITINKKSQKGIRILLVDADKDGYTNPDGHFSIEYPSEYLNTNQQIRLEYFDWSTDTVYFFKGDTSIKIDWKIDTTKHRDKAENDTTVQPLSPDPEVHTPSAKIHSSRIELNSSGMVIHVNFDVLFVDTGLIAVDFFDLNEDPLKDGDGSLKYTDGYIGKQREFLASNKQKTYKDFQFYIPYSELDTVNNVHESQYKITIYCNDKKSISWEEVAVSEYYDSSYYYK